MARKPRPRERAEDEVTEAGLESFPASDPPAYNTPGRAEGSERDDAPPRDTDDAAGRPAQRAAIEQSMARQNVRTGAGHAPTSGELADGRAAWTGRTAMIAAALLAVLLLLWLLFA